MAKRWAGKCKEGSFFESGTQNHNIKKFQSDKQRFGIKERWQRHTHIDTDIPMQCSTRWHISHHLSLDYIKKVICPLKLAQSYNMCHIMPCEWRRWQRTMAKRRERFNAIHFFCRSLPLPLIRWLWYTFMEKLLFCKMMKASGRETCPFCFISEALECKPWAFTRTHTHTHNYPHSKWKIRSSQSWMMEYEHWTVGYYYSTIGILCIIYFTICGYERQIIPWDNNNISLFWLPLRFAFRNNF